jgi:site-specific DNA recombinase
LVVYRIDRLVRPPEDGDEWDTPVLVRGLAKTGRELHAVDRGKIETTFAGLLIAMLEARSAGEERRRFLERSKRGRDAKAKSGRVVCSGQLPYGYKYNETRDGLEIVESEAAIVRLIFEWYVYGNGDGKPMKNFSIGEKLSAMGIETPGASRKTKARVRANGMWGEGAVHTILRRETYTGVWRYGKEIGRHKGIRPLEDQIAVARACSVRVW